MFSLCFAMHYFVSFQSSFAIILTRKRADCFAWIVFLVFCGCESTVALPLDAMDWSTMCDCNNHTHLLFDINKDYFKTHMPHPMITYVWVLYFQE